MMRDVVDWRICFLCLCLLVFPAGGATIFHWSFDGSAGAELISATEIVAGANVTAFSDSQLSPGATNAIRHGPPNPWFNTNGTSAEFLNWPAANDPGVALFKNDAQTGAGLDLSDLDDFTIEAFVYLYDLRQAVVLRKTDSSFNGYFIDVRSSGYFGFRLNTKEVVVNSAPIASNTWYHVGLVKDGANGEARFYVNGVLKANVALIGSLPDTPNSLGIGCYARDNLSPPENSGQFFNGRIDELRISNVALAPSDFLINNPETNAAPAGIVAIEKTETFDTENSAASHGWMELEARENGQDYGFSPTSHTGSGAGEAGGTMVRKSTRSSYCDVFDAPLTMENFIHASGKIVLKRVPDSGNASVLYGHGDQSKIGQNSEANQMGLVLATTPPSFFSHLTFSDGYRWEASLLSGLVTNQVYAWEYTFDPSANGGQGTFTVEVSAPGSDVTNRLVRELGPALRARGGTFDSFGITQRALSNVTPAPASSSYIDDLEYTAAINGISVQFQEVASSVLETAGAAGLNVVLSEISSVPVSVNFAVTGGTAVAGGADYSLANGVLNFPPGITNQMIPLTLIADGVTELDETVDLTLADPIGAGLGGRFRHTLTLINVDRLALNVQQVDENILFSWPVSFWNYHLQFRPHLGEPPSWVDVTNVITVSNGLRQVAMRWTNDTAFFRLAENASLASSTNSAGMKLVQLPAGSFTMGYWQSAPLADEILNVANWVPSSGDYDEKPAHEVTISSPFWMGANEVSNFEYEQFDPAHAALRGKFGFSTNDDDAVVFVSWSEAKAFCEWLSAREGRPYRLPTEAEWEYACRAGTTTHFSTGDTLPGQYLNQPGFSWWPTSGSPTSIPRGQTPPNPWGLYDMHGNVEEWCSDWYGPYEATAQTDPVGRINGLAKVTRGGSHSTVAFYLRSENRMGTLPQDKSWYIGFRVVMGESSSSTPLPEISPAAFQTNILQTIPAGVETGPDPEVPYFNGPWKYVKIPGGSQGPLYSGHNHVPAIAECPNGDLLAFWYTCVTESGRELALAASRLRYGETNWQNASSLYDMPDRNDHATALWFDGNQTLYHFNGLSAAATWGPLALMFRTSTNNGVDWSPFRIIAPEHTTQHMPIASVIKTSAGNLMFSCDAVTGGEGGSVVWISADEGQTWFEPGAGHAPPKFVNGGTGAWIAGIHAPMAELSNGDIIAFGRGNAINGRMPKSISTDGGSNWTYSASVFPPISGGQRATLLRLREGPLFFASFGNGLTFTNDAGGTFSGSGLFAAVSFDDGVTWPYRRLISDDGAGRLVETTDAVAFNMSRTSAEPKGYLASTQTRNGIIHIISSRQHYQFNLKWLETRPPSASP